MYEECCFHIGIHRDPIFLSFLCHGKDVGKRLGVVPDLTEIGEISNHIGCLGAAIREQM
jgi:hypothetical protein